MRYPVRHGRPHRRIHLDPGPAHRAQAGSRKAYVALVLGLVAIIGSIINMIVAAAIIAS